MTVEQTLLAVIEEQTKVIAALRRALEAGPGRKAPTPAKPKIPPDGTVETMLKACEGKLMHRILQALIDAGAASVDVGDLVEAEMRHFAKRSGKPADITATRRAVGLSINHLQTHAKLHGFEVVTSGTQMRLRKKKT